MSRLNLPARWPLAVCAIVLGASSAAFAQGTGVITGTVTDSVGVPIVGARVSVDGGLAGATSNQTGRYRLLGITVGPHTVRARLLGYRADERTVAVNDGDTTRVDFRLARTPVELERVVSTGYGTQTKATVTGAAEVVTG